MVHVMLYANDNTRSGFENQWHVTCIYHAMLQLVTTMGHTHWSLLTSGAFESRC